MKRHYRMLSLILAVSILIGMLTIPAVAKNTEPAAGTGYVENPLYDYHTDFEPALQETEAEQSAAAVRTAASFVPLSEAAEQLRDAMVARESTFTIYIAADSVDFNTVLQNAYSEDYANGITTGDYLRWSWSKMYWEYEKVEDGMWRFDVKAAYYDTYEEEQTFLDKLGQVMEELNIWADSDYMKYKQIYSYVVEHVVYDNEGLATHEDDTVGYDEEYQVKTYLDPLGNSDNLIYTAYDALCNGKAVCQGFAALIYAMCRSCDLNVRIQDGNNHSWNIVKLKSLWYYMDATWDAEIGSESRLYFLNGTAEFGGHVPGKTYLAAEYLAEHPMAEYAYEPQSSDYAAVLPFKDVSESDYFYTPVTKTYEWGIFAGATNDQFMPEQKMTRGMVVTVLYRLAGQPDYGTDSGFSDVSETQYYAAAITWAVNKGIAYGISDTAFAPDTPVTREQFMTFLFRYANAMGYDMSAAGNLLQYADCGDVSPYATATMQWAIGAGLIYGVTDTTLVPQGTATRGQVATILYRFIMYYGLDAAMEQEAAEAA